MRLLTGLRTLLHGSDATKAVADERGTLQAERARQGALSRDFAKAFSGGGPDAVELGTMIGGGHPVRLSREKLVGHTGVWGPSGCGKSYFTVTLLKALVMAGISRLVVLDPKAETVNLLRRALLDVARSLPAREAERLLSRVVCLDPFSKEMVPRLQLLTPEPGLDPELQAYAVARLITDESDMAVGVRQEALLHRVVECLIRAELPLTVLPQVLQAPQLLAALAERCAPAELFRSAATRLQTESSERVGGLLSRAERLLRLKSTRLALGAPDCLDFGKLLDEHIVLVNLEPPQGSVDVGRFLCGLLWVKLTQAIRRRPNGSPPAILVLEEAPAFLAATSSQAADSTEDLLRLARAKGVFLYLLSQDLASLGKVSPTLPTVIKTNIHLHAIFRTTDDWSFALPVTGRRLKSAPPPWEEGRAVGYLDRGAELMLLREGVARLPDRHLYLLDRRSGLPAALVRSADLTLRAPETEVQALSERTARSQAVVLVGEAEKQAAEMRSRLAALLAPNTPASAGVARLPVKRRGPRPVDMG